MKRMDVKRAGREWLRGSENVELIRGARGIFSLHHVAMEQAVFLFGRTEPAGEGTTEQNGNANAANNQGYHRFMTVPPPTECRQVGPCHKFFSSIGAGSTVE